MYPKKILMVVLTFVSTAILAQGGAQLYGVDPFEGDVTSDGGLLIINQQTGETTATVSVTESGNFKEVIAMALDSSDLTTVFVVYEDDGNSSTRTLGTIDLSTGVITSIGLLSDAIADIAFDGSGQLYGLTGNGGTDDATLFSINKSTGVMTLLVAMPASVAGGASTDGEALAFNPTDGFMYRISGNGTNEITTINLNTLAVNSVPVTTSVVNNGEGLSMVFDENLGMFVGTDRDNQLVSINSGTAVKSLIGTDPHLYVRGLVFFPSQADVIFYDGFEINTPPVN